MTHVGPIRRDSSVIVWFFQRRRYVIPERSAQMRGGGHDPVEPGHGCDRQQHIDNLLFARARALHSRLTPGDPIATEAPT